MKKASGALEEHGIKSHHQLNYSLRMDSALKVTTATKELEHLCNVQSVLSEAFQVLLG